MAGDYSRNTFDPTKHYTRVLKQQGRVDVDADWNENDDLVFHRVTAETRDLIGPFGAPRTGGGFEVGKTAGGDDLTLSPGNFYVDGILVELDGESLAVTTAAGQSQLAMPRLVLDGRKIEKEQWLAITTGDKTQLTKTTNVDPATATVFVNPAVANGGSSQVRRATTYRTQPDLAVPQLANGSYLVYLDVWEREISALDDPEIREIALGGPDTARRMKTVSQVRLLQVQQGTTCEDAAGKLRDAFPPSSGTLAARTAPLQGDTDPCHLPPTAGYLDMENRLYRVEIQRGGTLPAGAGDPPTFKWARDNATLEVGIKTITGREIEVTELGKDDLFRFTNDQWVEIVDEASLLDGRANALRQITVEDGRPVVTTKTDPPIAAGKNLKLRGWKQQDDADENGVAIDSNDFVTLEFGVQVAFADGVYHTGDYWLIPARTAIQDILWPRYDDATPEHRPPRGIVHHYAPLARIEVNDGTVADDITDCRTLFCTLVEACDEVDFDFYKKMLFGYGVACGLQLVCEGAGKQSVRVKPGYAIDCEGRDMILTAKNGKSVDLKQLSGWKRVLDDKATQAAVFITRKNDKNEIDFDVEPYKKEGWLAGTPLETAFEECQKPVFDYLAKNFARGNPDDPRVKEPEQRLITAWNLLVQLSNPQTGKHVYLSEREHEILAEVYGELRKLLRISNTYCALGSVSDFPKYPLKFAQETFFGKGDHTRVRVAPKDPEITVVFGGNDRINVFLGPELRFIHVYPDIGSAKVLDVAFGPNPKVLHVLAEAAGKSFIASCQFPEKDDKKAWTPPLPIVTAIGERIVQFADGVDAVEVYGLGEERQIYAIKPDSGAAKAVAENSPYERFFVVDGKSHRCFAAGRSDSTAKGQYDRIIEYDILENGAPFRLRNIYVLDNKGSEGIAFSSAGGKDLVCALVDKEKTTGMKAVVTFETVQLRKDVPLKTNSPLSITGIVAGEALAAVAVADENVVQFVRHGELLADRTTAVQICPSGLAANARRELLTVNHRSHTVSQTSKPATPFPMPELEKYRAAVLQAYRELVILMLESVKDCFCEHLMPDCPICTKRDVVYLGVLELDPKFTVRRICPLEKRTWLLSPSNLGYWLSIVPVLPAIRAIVEALCCIDIPELLKDKFTVPPTGNDRWKCADIPDVDEINFDRIREPFRSAGKALRKKAPFLFDILMGKKETAAVTPVKSDDVVGKPVDDAKNELVKNGVPVLNVEKATGASGFIAVLQPTPEIVMGQGVTLIERNGRVVNVVQHPAADQPAADTASLRDDIASLRAHADESRKLIDERDTTIRTLTDNMEKLQQQLSDARKEQKETSDRMQALAAKADAIDELQKTVAKLSAPTRKPVK